MHAVEDLVERVMGTPPLPCNGTDVKLLLADLRQQLPHLEQILEDANTAPDLVSHARSIRREPVPKTRIPLVILTIRFAEIACALMEAIPVNALPRHMGTQGRRPSASHTVNGR
ncbi:hypothetical protein [Streptomyces sp. MMBL 11-3]|uniref:hypothetical protein n=1 Tax=Streptomyces sp. MMBL 11-3 TaxID=3382639 RepID=UPI0039B44E58